jgi:hypothetical protein
MHFYVHNDMRSMGSPCGHVRMNRTVCDSEIFGTGSRQVSSGLALQVPEYELDCLGRLSFKDLRELCCLFSGIFDEL